MARRRLLARQAAGVLSMALGSTVVLGLVGAMNAGGDTEPAEQGPSTTRFVVEAPPPESEKPKKQPRKQRAPTKAPRSSAPPPPSLSGNLASLDMGLRLASPTDVGQMDKALLGDTQNVVMTEETVDVPPRPLSQPAPQLPARLREKGVSGSVTLSLLIGTDGKVEKARVLDASPAGLFEEPALEAVKSWRFAPARYAGEPVRIWARQTINFSMQ